MANISEPPNPKATGGQLSYRVAVSAVRRYPVVFSTVVLLALTVAGLVWAFFPTPKYTGAVVYRFLSQGPRVISPTLENQVDVRSFGARQAVSVKQRLVLNAVLNDPEVKK